MRDGFATRTSDPREIWVLAHLVRSPESLPDAFHVSHGWEAPSEEVISNREGVCTFVDQALENAGRGLVTFGMSKKLPEMDIRSLFMGKR
jgi:hypothetical protein